MGSQHYGCHSKNAANSVVKDCKCGLSPTNHIRVATGRETPDFKQSVFAGKLASTSLLAQQMELTCASLIPRHASFKQVASANQAGTS